ncbi:MAG: hypothetical protein NZT92_22810 [Abditibacteriales bacterium]|nr:hypothetical protein [Abditibacteriales bacterium]MDW8368461.1 hypothetical protein [Abditibacteriales bacterium]
MNLIHAITRSITNYALVEEINADLKIKGFTFAGWVNPGDLYNLLH